MIGRVIEWSARHVFLVLLGTYSRHQVMVIIATFGISRRDSEAMKSRSRRTRSTDAGRLPRYVTTLVAGGSGVWLLMLGWQAWVRSGGPPSAHGGSAP